jgi:acetolactate synthase-1/3 small subunit
MKMKHILSVLVNNHAGVLSRVSGLFSRRGFNIESLAVGVTNETNISRMTIVVDGDENTVDQVQKQLAKLIDVIKVEKLDTDNSVHRELALIKVRADTAARSEIMQIAEVFRANIIDISKSTLTIEISGSEKKVEAMQTMLRPFGIMEDARTGLISLERGEKTIVKPSSKKQ